jgi:hypothetical protein
MKKTKHLLTALALLAPLALCHPAKAEGIDCAKTGTYVDRMICTNPDFKAQDDTMVELYAVARVSMYGKGASGEIVNQKIWLADRDKCLKSTTDKRTSCVLDLYKTRNLELAFSAMPSAPEASLKVLHDQKIETEPYYEALTIFTSEPDGVDWQSPALTEKRRNIEKLVAPAFSQLQQNLPAHSDLRFNKDLFSDANFASTDDILKSTQSFANFFRAVTFGTSDLHPSAILPCGYVVSHQNLLDATDGYFGATPDNFIINSNCDVTAPATPKFHALLKQINGHWPQCDGTIRFAAFRDFGVMIDRVFSPSARAIEKYKPAAPRPKNEEHTLDGVSIKAISDAQTEMTNYYVKYLAVTQTKASIFAKAKIADVLYDGQQCE